MKAKIHPNYHTVAVDCSCGNKFKIESAHHEATMHIDVCNKCHPFYTGKQKISKTGSVERFRERFGGLTVGKRKEPEGKQEEPK